MKLLGLISTIIFLSLNASASQTIKTTGQNAKNIYNSLADALLDAGIAQVPTPGISFAGVSMLSCALFSYPEQESAACTARIGEKEIQFSSEHALKLSRSLADAGLGVVVSPVVVEFNFKLSCAMDMTSYQCSIN